MRSDVDANVDVRGASISWYEDDPVKGFAVGVRLQDGREVELHFRHVIGVQCLPRQSETVDRFCIDASPSRFVTEAYKARDVPDAYRQTHESFRLYQLVRGRRACLEVVAQGCDVSEERTPDAGVPKVVRGCP